VEFAIALYKKYLFASWCPDHNRTSSNTYCGQCGHVSLFLQLSRSEGFVIQLFVLQSIYTLPSEQGVDKQENLQLWSNVVVEWLTFLLRIREVSCSNLGPEKGYPN
jgi:hypothetical protein